MNFKKISNITLPVFGLFFIIATAFTGKQALVQGTLKNTGSSKYIYLFEFFGTELTKIDSTANNAGKFTFNFKKELPRGFYKIGTDEEGSVLLILGNESVNLTADLKIPEEVTVTGSKENAAYAKFKEYNAQQNSDFSNINNKAQQLQSLQTSNSEQYNKEIQQLQKQVDSLNNARVAYFAKLQNEYKGLFVEKFINIFAQNNVSKENFFSPSDFSDPELTRGDMLPTKISVYMQRYVDQDLESWKQESDKLLNKATQLNSNREVVYISVIRNMANNDIDYTRQVAKKYLKEFPASKYATKLWNLLPKSAPAVGEEAPDIKLTTADGKIITLSSLKGKVVLLDFWASWCGPCRRENPNVVKAYQKYKDKGFTVYSVSLDTEKEKWLKAINTDGLIWENHVSDLKGWQSSAAALYGVRGIPNTYLLDKEGKIIAVNPRGEALEETLEKYFD